MPTEVHGEYAVIKNLLYTGPVVFATGLCESQLEKFSPRIGFAWNVGGDGKTAIRGGFDYLYDLIAPQSGSNLLQSQLPRRLSPTRLQANNQASNIPFTLPLTFPATTGALAYRPTDWHIKQPAMLIYNLTVERQLPFDTAVTVAYAGSRGLHFMQEQEGDPLIPAGVPDSAGACVLRPAGQAANLSSMIDGQATACWASTVGGVNPNPRRNPNFGSTDLFTAAAQAWYNALQFGVTKRISRDCSSKVRTLGLRTLTTTRT